MCSPQGLAREKYYHAQRQTHTTTVEVVVDELPNTREVAAKRTDVGCVDV
jgi:hypothetical protein